MQAFCRPFALMPLCPHALASARLLPRPAEQPVTLCRRGNRLSAAVSGQKSPGAPEDSQQRVRALAAC